MLALRRARVTVAVAVAALSLVSLAVASSTRAQVIDDVTSTTTTSSTSAPSSTGSSSTTTLAPTPPTTTPGGSPTTAPPDDPGGGPTTTLPAGGGTAPPGPDDGDGGDGGDSGDLTPRTIPPDAQRIISSYPRTGPNSSQDLFDAVQELVDLGLTLDEAIQVGFGRFPVAGAANYSHDWLFPRWGPGFRFHKGTDVFAPFGTPLRAPVEGIATSRVSELGGLSTKIHMPDGTYFYYAHLSALVEGFENGMEVETGDIVGYIGDSGNARGGSPHLHIGVYPQGGEATDPKPILDQFLDDAMAQLPAIVEQVRAQRSATGAPPIASTPRSLLATSLLRPLTDRTAAGAVPTEVLYQASGNPGGGGVSVAETEAAELAASIDWANWEARAAAERLVVERAQTLLHLALGPMAPAPTAGTETAAP